MTYDPETYMPKVADWLPDIENLAIEEATKRYSDDPRNGVKQAFIAGALWGSIERQYETMEAKANKGLIARIAAAIDRYGPF